MDNNNLNTVQQNTDDSIEILPDKDYTSADTTFFKKMALPCLIFAALFVLFLHRNWTSYTMTLFVASLSALVIYGVRVLGREFKKDSRFIIGAMLLIAVSTFFTGSADIIFMNWIAEFILIVVLLLHNFANDSEWDFAKYIGQCIASVFLCIGKIGRPFSDLIEVSRESKSGKNKKAKYIAIGLVIAIPLLIIMGLLLSSADMVFSDFLGNILDAIVLPENFFSVLFMFVFGFFASFCGICYMFEDAADIRFTKKRNGEPLVAITIMAALSVMYLAFSVVQILYLFVGGLTLPEGVTYAEYARTGFFQLLVVCVLNLIAVLVMKKRFKENKLLSIILLVVSGCTYIMIASSAMRMIMYIRAYHLTFLRVFVLVALFTLAILLGGVIFSIFKEKFNFFKFGVAVVSVIYILFAFSHSEYFIAKYNFSKDRAQMLSISSYEYVDLYYISALSTDAAPAIADFFEERNIPESTYGDYNWYRYYISGNEDFIKEGTTFRKFNLSAYLAKKTLKR